MITLLFRFFLVLTFVTGVFLAAVWAKPLQTPLQIQADIFELDSQKNLLVTSGNVVAIQDEVVLKGPYGLYNQPQQRIAFTRGVEVTRGEIRLVSDSAIADGKLQRIILTGNVQFFYKDIVGNAGTGVYDLVRQTVAFSGTPNVRQGQDRLTGEKMLFDSKTGKMTTIGKARILLSVDKFQ